MKLVTQSVYFLKVDRVRKIKQLQLLSAFIQLHLVTNKLTILKTRLC